MKLRPYQKTIIEIGKQTLLTKGFVYLAMEVRTGKTLTSLGISQEVKASKVLFITKKKAISSIQDDYELFNPDFDLSVINYESLHKIPKYNWDVVICDEAHSMGAFPKPSKRAKQVKVLLKHNNPYVILLSGTPTPESFSQMYHQVFGIPNNPFAQYKNFYRFSDDYINVKVKPIGGLQIRDYSNGHESIINKMQPCMINFSQKNAGFKVETTEEILYVRMKDATYSLAKKLQKNLVVEGESEVILGDTPVKLMSKLHQIYSGTVKFESGNSMVLDLTKAEFIKKNFADKKIAIFYKFKEELNAIKEVYGETISTELSVFKETNKSIERIGLYTQYIRIYTKLNKNIKNHTNLIYGDPGVSRPASHPHFCFKMWLRVQAGGWKPIFEKQVMRPVGLAACPRSTIYHICMGSNI